LTAWRQFRETDDLDLGDITRAVRNSNADELLCSRHVHWFGAKHAVPGPVGNENRHRNGRAILELKSSWRILPRHRDAL
jgi:hypothetical protein